MATNVQRYQCEGLPRHAHLIQSALINPLYTFRSACNTYAAIAAPTVAEVITFSDACSTFDTAVAGLTTPSVHDFYAAADVKPICNSLGETHQYITPDRRLCTTPDGTPGNGINLFVPGFTSVSMTTTNFYATKLFDKDVQGCFDVVTAVTPGHEVHLITGTDCTAINPATLVEGKAIAAGLCHGLVWDTAVI